MRKNRKAIGTDIKRQIRTLAKEHPVSEIAKRLGIHYASVVHFCKKEGIQTQQQNSKEPLVANKVQQLAAQGLTMRQIAEEMHYTYARINTLTNKYDIPIKRRHRNLTQDEKLYIEAMAGLLPARDIASELKISLPHLYHAVKSMEGVSLCRDLDYWSANYLAGLLKVSVRSIIKYISRGLKCRRLDGKQRYAIRPKWFLDFYYGVGQEISDLPTLKRIDPETIERIKIFCDYGINNANRGKI